MPPRTMNTTTNALVPVLKTEQDKKDFDRLVKLEERFEQGHRQSIEALREIFNDKLYKRWGFETQKEYMLQRWGNTRQWANTQIHWLQAVEYLESKGVKNPLQNLLPEHAIVFREWQHQPDAFYGAYVRLADSSAQVTEDALRKECDRQSEFLRESDHTPGLTFAEFQEFKKLAVLPNCWNRNKFQDLAELQAYILEHKQVPPLQTVAQVARGQNLTALVQALEPAIKDAAKATELKKKKDEHETERRRHQAAIRELEGQIADLSGKEDRTKQPEGEEQANPAERAMPDQEVSQLRKRLIIMTGKGIVSDLKYLNKLRVTEADQRLIAKLRSLIAKELEDTGTDTEATEEEADNEPEI